MDTMFRKTIRQALSWALMVQMLLATVYLPAHAQVPPASEEAGDWQVYKQSLGSLQEGYVNLLIILDTSDSMNQPESWRPYPGSYNSHVEYLWNDPIYISQIQPSNPPAPTSTGLDSRQVRIGYFTYLLETVDANITDETLQNNRRKVLRDAALADAKTDVVLNFPSGTQTVPKWLYRNYGGPMEFSYANYNTYRWFNSSWIYFVPSSLAINAANLANSPYLYSTSLSRFLGANNQSDVQRASIQYKGQLDEVGLSIDDRSGQFNSHARFDGMDYEKFNTCDASRYDERVTKLTGLGLVASGIKPSTVFMPATPGYYSRQASGAQRDTTAIPMVGFNTGYAKNLHYVRFDPYFESTQTRPTFINNYPGPGAYNNPAPETWPPTNSDFNFYHERSGNMRFNSAYFDLRCYTSVYNNPFFPTLDTSKYFKNNCKYEFKNAPRRDNFAVSYTGDRNDARYFGLVNGDGTTSKAPVLGMNGLPIRVLRYKFVPDTGDAPALPSTRKLTLSFGPCANSGLTTGAAEFGPGGYNDYVCRNSSNAQLYMTWSGIRSDLGGFNYAYALYDIFANLKKPDPANNQTTPTDLTDAERETILSNILRPYSVSPLSSNSRWNYLNNGSAFSPSALSQWMFAGYLGTRDCFDGSSGSFNHCSGVSTGTEELATGVSGYVDYTRTTYNYCVKPDGTASYTDASTGRGCYTLSSVAPSAATFSRTYAGDSITPYYSLPSVTWQNSSVADIGIGTTVTFGPHPTGKNWLWLETTGVFGGAAPASGNREQTISLISKYADKVGVVWSSNGAANTQIMQIQANGNVCSRSTPATASQSSVDGGTTWQNADTVVATPSNTVIFRPSPSTGKWYWVGDNNFYDVAASKAQLTLPAAEVADVVNRKYFGINFDSNDCASVVEYNVIANPLVPIQVRSNTYAVNDPNINGVIAGRNDTITTGINGDVSDTLGLVAENFSTGDDNNLFYGAIEINGISTTVPPDFKQYKRTALCTLDRSGMDFVWADNPGSATSTSFYFNQPTCTRQDPSGSTYNSSALGTCQVSTGGGGYTSVTSTTEFAANCAAITEATCSYSPPSRGNITNINVFAYQGCGMFTFSSGYEGGGSSAAGKTCGLLANNNYYVIDHDNKGLFDANNPAAYQAKESTLLSIFNANRATLNSAAQPIGIRPNNFLAITSLKGGYAPLTPAKNLLSGSPYMCSQVDASILRGSSTPPGFAPVYYTGSSGNYDVYNAQNGYSCSTGTIPSYSPGNEVTPPTSNINPSSYFLSIYAPVTGGSSFGSGTTNTEANNAKATGDVGQCRLNEQYSSGYRQSARDAALAPTETSNVRLFEAYNVLKYGSGRQTNNSTLLAPGAGGGVFPHFIYACTESPSPKNTVLTVPGGLGMGSRSNWDTSSSNPRFFMKFDQFQDAKYNIKNYVKPENFLDSEPALSSYKGLFDLGGSVSTSYTPGSQVDLYSVNYLNFVFGPKYLGSPIGRRTRFQLAQDTLAEIISSTTSQIRIGLMFFNQPDGAGVTNGGYVAKRIAALEPKICPSTSISMSVSADGRTLTSVGSVDNWFDRVPSPTGSATIPAAVSQNLVKGGTIKFPANSSGFTFLPIAMTGINDSGTITLDTPADSSFVGRTVTVTMENCNLANYPGLSGHRAALVETLYKKRALSQTPLTEVLYEAYLYFHGGSPKFGKYVTAAGSSLGSPEADIAYVDSIHPAGVFTDSSYNQYLSPMTDLIDSAGNDYGQCSNNNILLITDGYSFGDFKANNDILGLPASGGVSTLLNNDNNIRSTEKIFVNTQTTSGLRSVSQFLNPDTGAPYGPTDDIPSANNSFSLFDELAYYLGNADISPASIPSFHNVKLYTAALDINCSPVVRNAIDRNRGGQCAEISTASNDLVSVIQNLLSSLNNWVPSVNVAAIPLPVSNRSSSSVESYMGLFTPSNSRVWKGNLKKYQLAFGPAECGVDALSKPIDVCITGKNVLSRYSLGSLAVNSRNILTRPSSVDDVSIAVNATDYWSPTPASENNSGEGFNVNAGGVVAQMKAKPFPAGTNIYTFLPTSLPSGVINTSLSADLTANINRVTTSNTMLARSSNFGEVFNDGQFSAMPSTTAPSDVINFMLGASSTTPSLTTIRNTPHGDVMHSSPTSLVYKSGSSQYSRVFYLTGLGDLVSVNDQNSNSGEVAWRFYPFEAVKRQYEIMKNYNTEGAETKIFGADGAVSSLIYDNNRDGYVDPNDGDKAYIAFGMRRGGRAIYVLDVTYPDAPKLQWMMSNEGICKPVGSSGTISCSTAATYLASNPNVPANMFSELGFTWSTPLMGFVNSAPQTNGDGQAFTSVYNIKNKMPVVVFGGGYDPEEDKQTPDPSRFTMGRAVYVMEALTGTPLKIWSHHNQTARSADGIMVENTGGTTTATCKADMSISRNPFYYPIASAVYGMNVDYDGANTIDRLYVGDLGGQLFRFDIGTLDFASTGTLGVNYWRGTLMGNFNGKTTSTEFDLTASTNKISNGTALLYKRSRKFMQPPVVASWTRNSSSNKVVTYNYIYAITGDIEHPWQTGIQDLAVALVDTETGVDMQCAPKGVGRVGNVRESSNNSADIFLLPDITLEGRVDLGSKTGFGVTDGVIDIYDLPKASDIGNSALNRWKVSRENLTRAIDFTQTARLTGGTPNFNNGLMGWFYRMEPEEKGVAGARVINGQFTWTAFAASFIAGLCSRGTGTKYYLDAYNGVTVDTNFNGKASDNLTSSNGKGSNCLNSTDYSNAYNVSLLSLPTGSATTLDTTTIRNATIFEGKLRTPLSTSGSSRVTAGLNSRQCDSPRPIYNTSYGLLQNDVQVAHDGVLYRVGFVPTGNSNDYAYDENGLFLGINNSGNYQGISPSIAPPPSGTKAINDAGGTTLNPNATTAAGGAGSRVDVGALGAQAAGVGVSFQTRPAQVYWYRDDLH